MGWEVGFGAHIFFDDQDEYCAPASHVMPTARVLCATPGKFGPQRELPFIPPKHRHKRELNTTS